MKTPTAKSSFVSPGISAMNPIETAIFKPIAILATTFLLLQNCTKSASNSAYTSIKAS